MLPIILDTDIGTDVDDALALAFAAHSTELDIRGVTTVGPNPERRARIARKLLNKMGLDSISVYAGNAFSMPNEFMDRVLAGYEKILFGHEGCDFIETEQDGLPVAKEHAVDFIIKLLKSSDTRITVVAIGPLTNIADALRREPSITKRIERIILMGGSVTPGDILKKEGWLDKLPACQKACWEYNMNSDKTASEVVLKAGIPLLVVPAEITYRTWLTEDERRQLKQSQKLQGDYLNSMCDYWVKSFREELPNSINKVAQIYLHDPLTVATAFRKDFVTIEKMHLAPGYECGIFRTLREENKPANAEVVTDLDKVTLKCLVAKRAFGVTFT